VAAAKEAADTPEIVATDTLIPEVAADLDLTLEITTAGAGNTLLPARRPVENATRALALTPAAGDPCVDAALATTEEPVSGMSPPQTQLNKLTLSKAT